MGPLQAEASPSDDELGLGGLSCLVLFMALAGVLLSAIPIAGGVLSMVFGALFVRWGRSQRRTARRHLQRLVVTTPLSEAAVGDVLAIEGRVTSAASIETPLGHAAVVAVSWVDTEPDEVRERSLWHKQHGSCFEIECDGGVLSVEGSDMDIVVAKPRADNYSDGLPAQLLSKLTPLGLPELPANEVIEYGEQIVKHGATVVVSGEIVHVESLPSVGYRDGGGRRRLHLTAPVDGTIAITSGRPALTLLARQGAAQAVAGVACLLIGAASVAGWIVYFR